MINNYRVKDFEAAEEAPRPQGSSTGRSRKRARRDSTSTPQPDDEPAPQQDGTAALADEAAPDAEMNGEDEEDPPPLPPTAST